MHPTFNPDGLVCSETYAEVMRETVLPYIEGRRTNLTLPGDGGRPLFVSRFDAGAPRGTVLMVHGFTESADKFAELIHSLLRNGMNVVAWDQRGHGRSWRDPTISDRSLTHVDAFEEYVQDMSIVYDAVVGPMPRPHRAFCHSMGGAVTALFLESQPGLIDRAAMCAPMIAPAIPMPLFAARLLCRSQVLLGRGKRRIPGSKPYSGPESFETACSTGRARFEWYDALRNANPALQNNGPSYGWTLEAVNVTDKILAPGAVERIDARIRLYTAALDDTVLPEAQQRFIGRVKDGERIVVENAKHEIYRSADDVLFPWWHDVLNFMTDCTE